MTAKIPQNAPPQVPPLPEAQNSGDQHSRLGAAAGNGLEQIGIFVQYVDAKVQQPPRPARVVDESDELRRQLQLKEIISLAEQVGVFGGTFAGNLR